jgi:Family of unknown function (DUF5906)
MSKNPYEKVGEIIDSAQGAEIVTLNTVGAKSTRRRRSDRAAPESAADGGPSGPRTFGFDVGGLNSKFALVLMGSKAVVYFEQPDAPLEGKKRVLALGAFNAWFANRFTEIRGADGKIKPITWATAWMQSKRRRSYSGIEFHPDPNNEPGTDGYLNLWSGFAIEPARERDCRRYGIFRDHLLNNVCRGDETLFQWVFGFFAHIVQRPRERLGVSLVMRGKMGSGKTKVGEIIGSLFPQHYFLVDDPRYVTGQFNAHMATCLLLQADEAVWAGDKAAEGRLKGLVTSPIQQIEQKGIDPIRLPNYVRLILTSNEDWVVPAGKDERRFCVVDVDPRCAKDHGYFREMDEELESGGREALLADLLGFDLDSVNMRQIPHTDALLEQKLDSLNSVDNWWHERLVSGFTTRSEPEWKHEILCDTLFDDYIAVADKIGVKRKSEQTRFGQTLHKLVPGLSKKRPRAPDGDRRLYYVLPPLNECRAAFERTVEQPIRWEPDSAPSGGGNGVVREIGIEG